MITVACACGKKFRTSDANAGKRGRCPACGAALTIPQSAAAAAQVEPEVDPDSLDGLAALAGSAGAEVFQPAEVGSVHKPSSPRTSSAPKAASFPGVPAPKPDRNARSGGAITPSISVSPMIVVLIVLAIVIPAAIYWAEHGPMEANRQWKQIADVAQDNLLGQADRAMKHEYSDVLADQFAGLNFRPKANSMFFDEPPIMWRLPESIHFQITTTDGIFKGEFHPRTWQFEMSGKIAGTSHTLTGSASNNDQSLFMDGKQIN